MGVGGSAAKYITRYELALSSQNPRTEKNFSLLNTVFHILTGRCSLSSTCVSSLYVFSTSENQIFLQNNTVTQAEKLVSAQVMLLSWKRIRIQTLNRG